MATFTDAYPFPETLNLIRKLDKRINSLKDDTVAKAALYTERTMLVYQALSLAADVGLPCGIRFDGEGDADKDFPVVVVKLPTGEVAWPCKAYGGAYDGHTTEEKYKRIEDYVAHRRLY